jgi:hypothetical protein
VFGACADGVTEVKGGMLMQEAQVSYASNEVQPVTKNLGFRLSLPYRGAAMGEAGAKHDGRVDAFLPSLVSAVRKVNDEGAEITTASFTALMDQVVRVFDHLGTVLHFAKHDMVVKNDSLKAVAHRLKYLQQVCSIGLDAGVGSMLRSACTSSMGFVKTEANCSLRSCYHVTPVQPGCIHCLCASGCGGGPESRESNSQGQQGTQPSSSRLCSHLHACPPRELCQRAQRLNL